MRRRSVVLVVGGLMLASFLGAQETLPQRARAPEWGTDAFSIYTVQAFEFVPIDSNTTYDHTNWMKYITGGFPSLVAGVHLPSGVLLDSFWLAGCDEDGATDFTVRFWQCPSTSFTDACVAQITEVSDSLSGCGWVSEENVGLTIDNPGFTYFVEVNPYALSSAHRIDHVEIYYQLQVSPPPPGPSFGDVPPGHLFFQHIEALYASRITAGCGGGNYCPDAPLTRGQMAVFLAKGLGLHWASGP